VSLSMEEIRRIQQIQAKHNTEHFCGIGCPFDCDVAFLISLAYRQFPAVPIPPDSWMIKTR
jgi:hypothetical protein